MVKRLFLNNFVVKLKLWKRYSWNDEESKEFVNNNFLKIAKECKLLPFTKEILAKLKEENNKIIIISARGDLVGEEMIEVANKQLEEADISKKHTKDIKKSSPVIGQVDMFNLKGAKIADELERLDLNGVTPLDALNILVKIKEKMQ